MNVIKTFRNGYGIIRVLKTNIRYYYQDRATQTKAVTLTGRIATYIDTQYSKPRSLDETTIDRNVSNQESVKLQNLLKFLEEKVLRNKPILPTIDTECCSKLQQFGPKEILLVLNFLMRVDPNRITKYRLYTQSLQSLLENISNLAKEELLQVIFYIGLSKDQSAQGMLKKCLVELHQHEISNLTVEEMCIVCNSAFRTSTRIRSRKILGQIHRILNEKLFILKDPALFVTFVKSIRHNREQTEDLLSTISCAIFFNRTYGEYSFTAICHIAALFADYAYYDEALFKLLTGLAAEEIRKMGGRTHELRNKDITRFLWSLSMLYYFNTDDIKKFVSIIEEKVAKGHYKNDIEELVSTILSLWILDYQPVDLVKYALTADNISSIKNIKSRTKLRMHLLTTCIFLENKELYKTLNLKNETIKIHNTQQQIDRRPVLSRVFNALKLISQNHRINKFNVTYEIPHLNICGITGYEKKIYKRVFVEVLDDYVTVKNQDCWPTGPMRLKLRLLKRFDENLVLVDADAIEEMTEKELEDFLRCKLDSCC